MPTTKSSVKVNS